MVDGQPSLYLFAVYSALIWLLWVIKTIVSSRYRPYTGAFDGTTSVIVPVVDEPLDLFRDVLGRMVEQRPGEIIVVINGAPNPGLVEVCQEFAPLVSWVHTPIPGKRNAVKIGTELATGEIAVLVDSDTVWTEHTLDELVKPFADPRVGGVSTRQRILEPTRKWITRWADWLENSRSLYSMPTQSVVGQVGCLPGRTIAFRRSIILRVMDDFMNERFLGVFLEVSDDRTLTNLTLKAGYRTVYQHTSLVYTDAPLQLKKLFKQQLRWARGSQYNTLRMMPWMLAHAPLLAMFFAADIILPFLLYGVILGWVYRGFTGHGYDFYSGILHQYGAEVGVAIVVGLMIASSVLSMGIRQMRHLAEKPSDFIRMPFFILFSTLFLMPVRLIGFVRMAHASGWGTRAGAYGGGRDDALGSTPIVAGSPRFVSAALASAAPPRVRGMAAGSTSDVGGPVAVLTGHDRRRAQRRALDDARIRWPPCRTSSRSESSLWRRSSLSSVAVGTRAAAWWANTPRNSRGAVIGAAALVFALAAVSTIVWTSPATSPVSAVTRVVTSVEAQNRLVSQRNRLQAQAAQLQVETSALQNQLAAMKSHASGSDSKLVAVTAEVASLSQQIGALTSQLDAANSKIAAMSVGKSKPKPKLVTPTVTTITAPTKAQIMDPASPYFGLYTAQAPFNWATFDQTAAEVGSQPGAVGFFVGWDQAYRANAVTAAWSRGILR